ncbi:Ell-associated factor Eaf [Phytophthora citrophthora]|uniref:Ell-associated factor Eaf n=1 Tax=Phytophthora citrophthora TaxID=4793 RepID=A0AAD9GUP2_9STRA|nr:Ell-associated factor Eaf [Phytophthora citrophthora]
MASDEEAPTPLDDCEYPVTLGQSLLDTEENGDEQQHSSVFTSFGYEFQPASVDKSTPGLVGVDGSNGVQVLMGSSTGAPGGVSFKGKMVEHKETDCLLIFDGSGFRLERCPFSCMQLRHVRAPTPRRSMKIPSKQVSNTEAESGSNKELGGSMSVAVGSAKTGKKPIGRPKGSRNKKPREAANAAPTVKRPRGRPKGSTKAVIAAKKARLEAQTKVNAET